VKPSYEQIRFDASEKRNRLKRLAGPDGGETAAKIGQDAHVFVAELEQGVEVEHGLGKGRGAWVQVVRGSVDLNGVALEGGDAAAVTGEERVTVRGTDGQASEVLLFDVV
jgi:redox-sensitive bicupin YhaK (pirin superfamily)